MEAALAAGVSTRRLYGWEPSVTTEYEYDDAGRMVRAVEVREPEYDPVERGLLIARQLLEEDRCPGCGDWLSETTTDVPPHEDRPDHGYRMHQKWCRTCVAHARFARQMSKYDESLRDTVADPFPEARRVVAEEIPLPEG